MRSDRSMLCGFAIVMLLSLLPEAVATTDYDGDGVNDADDFDDDNDGITDADEGDGLIDSDGDGFPDSKDTDADDDGCLDSREAGFTDSDGDGEVDGTGIDSTGVVIGGDGYSTPLDSDGNGNYDFQEAGVYSACANSQTLGSCSFPPLNHALLLFGDGIASSFDYRSANISFGNTGADYVRGFSLDGKAQFPAFTISVAGMTGYPSEITESFVGNASFNTGLASTFSYSQEDWVAFAESLYNASQQDSSVNSHINFYVLNGGSVNLSNDGPDYPTPANQRIHVVLGEGTVYPPSSQQDKVDSAIIAPQALIDTDRLVQHYHGFVVAQQFIETIWTVNTALSTGLAIHGQIPTSLMTCAETDTDGDGVIDGQDIDDDNDGITDADEGDGLVDSDGDGTPNSKDTDSDDDGCLDAIEGDGAYTINDLGATGGILGIPDSAGLIGGGQGPGDSTDPTVSSACVTDSDGDGLLDIEEDSNGNGIVDPMETDPFDADTDNDGIDDGTELGLNQDIDPTTTTDPLNADTDADGLLDGIEDTDANGFFDVGETNPLNADTDADGLLDGIEDTDANGIVDPGESDPLLIDSDFDGIEDGTEAGVYNDLDPSTTTDPANPDTDSDGLMDGEEDVNANGAVDSGETNPGNSDSDGDGEQCNDGYEVNQMGTDPLNPDFDGDGYSDCDEEFIYNTDPTDGTSYPNSKPTGCSAVSRPSPWNNKILWFLGILLWRRKDTSSQDK